MIVERPFKDTDIVCTCMGLTVAHIRQAISDGASTIEEVLTATGAGSICGECTGIAVAAARDILSGNC